MKPLYTNTLFLNSKSTDKLPCKCYQCDSIFYEQKKSITYELKHHRGRIKFCSQYCNNLFNNIPISQNVNCSNCDKIFKKKLSQIKKSKSGNHFCSKSCSATFNNKHKSYGIKRSKLEVWLEEQLSTLYPNIEIQYNQKSAISSELDIYIPSINLAFELNGIFHYKPIFGEVTLSQIQNNDQNKINICQKENIELHTINSSALKKFKPEKAQKYMNIIKKIINNKTKNLLRA